MRKYIIIIAFLLIFTVSLFGYPLAALSVNEASFTANTTVTTSVGDFTVISGSAVDQIVVDATTIQLTLSASSTGISLQSAQRFLLNNDGGIDTNCGDPNYSQLDLTGVIGTITVTPSTSTCAVRSVSSGGGGGGGGATTTTTTTTTTTATTTTTGEATITASGGGGTTITTSENSAAGVTFPANAVSGSTDVTVAFEVKANVTASRPIPSGKSVVGSYVYDFTAASGGTVITAFSESVTLTFTYTDSQIAGLNENTLKIYYWDGTQWLYLSTIVNIVTNTLTAVTDHFTYFAIFGESETPSEMATPEDYGLTEGDLISAEGDFDIFIINQYGYKRLFLNPAIFEMYGHLGSWDDVKTVAPETRDAFVTSSHYRYVEEDKVYHLEVTGEDTGALQWINMTAENFIAQGGTANGIFTINKSELDWYPKGVDKTSL